MHTVAEASMCTHTSAGNVDMSVAEVMRLRQKFEEDKRQIAAMKAARKFRPY